MKLMTEVNIEPSKIKIGYNDKCFLIGSCFADNLGRMLKYYRFDCLCNPFGVLYNPASIYNAFMLLITKTLFTENDIIETNNSFNSLFHHTSFARNTKEEFLENANRTMLESAEYLYNSTTIIITLGTAWCYRNNEQNFIVANCNKLNPKLFTRELLSVSQITNYLNEIKEVIESKNLFPNLKQVILTVSPIRHMSDSAHGNQISKSSLILGTDAFINDIYNSNVPIQYFPSYEIILDELRDYRFYSEDLVHPSEIAVKYIFEKFADCYFNNETLSKMKLAKKITQAEGHIPHNKESETYENFLKEIDRMREIFEKK